MKQKPLLVLTSFVLLAATCRKHEFSREHLMVETSFEGNDPFDDWENNQHCCDYSLTQDSLKYTDGRHSMRIDVKSTDPMVSASIRSEIVQPPEVGTDRWYGFNVYLENWTADSANESIFQWHPANATGVGTASVWASGTRFLFQRDPSGSNTASEYMDLGPIISDKWVAWVLHIKWASDNSGIIQVWKNGVLMIDRSGIKTSPPEGTYFKLGINKFGWGAQPSNVGERVLYYDEVRIGDESASYADVKPGK